MEDVSAPRSKAIIFAVFSLLIRLVACQSSVFSLWFSRRSYERSRGEMITMLYEKTLSRKVISESALSEKLESVEGEPDDIGPECNTALDASGDHSKGAPGPIKKFGRYLMSKIWQRSSHTKVAQPASIGKIYNLMRLVILMPTSKTSSELCYCRNDVYEVAQR